VTNGVIIRSLHSASKYFQETNSRCNDVPWAALFGFFKEALLINVSFFHYLSGLLDQLR